MNVPVTRSCRSLGVGSTEGFFICFLCETLRGMPQRLQLIHTAGFSQITMPAVCELV